jgi:hypothetical protein
MDFREAFPLAPWEASPYVATYEYHFRCSGCGHEWRGMVNELFCTVDYHVASEML